MKLNKKILSVFVFFALVLSYCFPVAALATTTGSNTDKLTEALKNVGVPEESIGNVSGYLQSINISDTTYTEINNTIDDTVKLIGTETDITKLSDSVTQQVESNITAVFNKLGLQADFTTNNDTGVVDLAVSTKGSNPQQLFTMTSDTSSTANTTVTNLLTDFSADKVQALKEVVTVSKDISGNNGTFTPTTGTVMNQTATNYENIMVLGLALVLISGAWILADKKRIRC